MNELGNIKFKQERYIITKYNGDAPKEGESKTPIEIIELRYENEQLVEVLKESVK